MAHNAKVITISNFKGGTGKTTGTAGLAYVLARSGYKVLVMDFDPQTDITFYFMPDYDVDDEEMTFFEAIEAGDLLPVVKKVHPEHKLFLIPGALDMTGLPDLLFQRHPRDLNARNRVISKLIDPLREKFDFIFVDVPPTISSTTNNAFAASDYIIISLQTQAPSFRAMQNVIPEIRHLVETLDIDLKVLGVMAIIHSNLSASEARVLTRAQELFGNAMFSTIVKSRERIRSWYEYGISDNPNDRWDQDALGQFDTLALEVLSRIQTLDKESEVKQRV